MVNIFKDKTLLVLGGAGSIGSEIIVKLVQYEPKAIRILDINETALADLENKLQSDIDIIRPFIGDIKDKERLKRAMEDVQIVFHAAALKHVSLCEYNPFEAIKTNVVGTQNIIEVAMDANVERMITISTDKAVNPASVMGATKLLAERLTISANSYQGLHTTIYSCVRFGNVLNSRGSVVPLFKGQVKKGGPVTITHPEMTRFVMSIPKAVDLVIKAAEMSKGGEIFIFKMPALFITDLAAVMIRKLAPVFGYNEKDIKTMINGKRVGEKLYEELLTEDEVNVASETDDMYIINRGLSNEKLEPLSRNYRSDEASTLLTKEAIWEILQENISTLS